MAGNQSKAVVVMIRGLGQIQNFERRGPWFKTSQKTQFFFLSSFALVISFLFKIKANTTTAFVEGR